MESNQGVGPSGPAEDLAGEGVAVMTPAPGADGDDVATQAAARGEDCNMMKEEAGKAIDGGQEYGA